jgi:hypothetical protein
MSLCTICGADHLTVPELADRAVLLLERILKDARQGQKGELCRVSRTTLRAVRELVDEADTIDEAHEVSIDDIEDAFFDGLGGEP